MQENQIGDHALTLHVKAGSDPAVPDLRLVVDAPTIQLSDGSPVLTITLSVTWGSENQTRLHDEVAQQLPRQTPSLLTLEAQPRPTSRFRHWYLCQRDGAEWSLEVDDPTHKDSCPICSGEASAIAVLALPNHQREETQRESQSKFTLRRSLGALYRG